MKEKRKRFSDRYRKSEKKKASVDSYQIKARIAQMEKRCAQHQDRIDELLYYLRQLRNPGF